MDSWYDEKIRTSSLGICTHSLKCATFKKIKKNPGFMTGNQFKKDHETEEKDILLHLYNAPA